MATKSDKQKELGYYKVRRVGGGLSISIPQSFIDAQHWKRGMYVKITSEGNKLVIIPIKEK